MCDTRQPKAEQCRVCGVAFGVRRKACCACAPHVLCCLHAFGGFKSSQQPVFQRCCQGDALDCANAGAYMCLECAFFDDETEKKQFHCSSCGICRVGGREKFFHCNTCGCCYSRQLEVRPAR